MSDLLHGLASASSDAHNDTLPGILSGRTVVQKRPALGCVKSGSDM